MARREGGKIKVAVVWGVCCAAALAGCGGDNPTAPPAGTVNIDILASGPSPREVTVAVGSRVNFTNRDTRPHAVSSDPVQTHTDCPAINDIGTLNPGQSRLTGALTAARVCGFHDHNNETDPTFKGRIVVQ
jgi:plastocyanin